MIKIELNKIEEAKIKELFEVQHWNLQTLFQEALERQADIETLVALDCAIQVMTDLAN